MASNIKFKRSAVQNRVPTTSQLDLGELALNTYDGKLYTEINTGSAAVIEIGSKLSSLVVDGANGAGGGDVVFHGTTAGRDLTWDYSHNTLSLADNVLLGLGNSNDLLIHHTGSTGYIKGQTGNLYIQSDQVVVIGNQSASTAGLKFTNGGAAELFHNNLLRIATTADGADISGTGSLKLPVGTTAQRNSSPTSGDIRFNSTLGAFEGYSGAGWGELGGGGIGIGSTAVNPASGLVTNRIGVGFTDINVVGTGISVTGYGSTIVLDFNDFKPGSFNRSIHNYTATAGQTTFAGLSYDNAERQIAVYLNGARLSEATYTATSGTTVVLDVGASVGDEVEIINININSDVDRNVNTYTATAGQTTFTGLSYNNITELDVYLNGIRLATGDFTATTGNTVVLAVGASVNDIVDIVSTGDGVSFRSTTDTSGDKYTLTNVGIGTDITPDKLNVRGNVNVVGVLTATTLHGDGSNLTNTGSTLSEPSSGTQRLVTTSLTTGTMTSSGTGSELAFDYANNHLEFSDGTRATFGTGNDLHLYHDGNNSAINETGTGSLYIQGSNNIYLRDFDTAENHIVMTKDGSVDLYHNGSKKFETTSTGATVTGRLTVDGLDLGDSETLRLGASQDLQLFHNGNHSYISDLGAGDLRITGSAVHIQNAAQSENMIKCFEGDRIELYHNNSKKFETTSTGAKVTGNLEVTGVLTYDDVTSVDSVGIITARAGVRVTADGSSSSNYISVGAGNDVKLYHDGSHSYIDNNTGSLRFRDAGGAEKFRISGTGTQFNDDITLSNDNDKLNIGAGSDIQIWHDGSESYVKNANASSNLILESAHGVHIKHGGENMAKFIQDAGVELYYDNARKFRTVSDGCEITSAEAGDACLALIADEGDDNADYFRLKTANSGGFYLQNYAAGSWENNIKAVGNGAVELYNDNVLKFQTAAHGATLSGNLNINGVVNANIRMQSGPNTVYASVDFYNNAGSAANSINSWAASILFITGRDATVFSNSSAEICEIVGTGIHPRTASTACALGTSSKRWDNVYADAANIAGLVTVDTSTDEKLVLQGSTNPILRFKEGSTNKAWLQWHGTNGYVVLGNNEDNTGIRLDDQLRVTRDGFTTMHQVWDAGNDGSGSGLDADTLDGVEGASFLRSDANDTASGALTFTNNSLTLSGHWYSRFYSSTQNYIHLYPNGHTGNASSTDIRAYNGVNGADVFKITGGSSTGLKWRGHTIWTAENDGTGSGLDADTLDGVQGSSFLRSDADDTIDATLTTRRISVQANHDIRFSSGNWTGDASYKIQVHSSTMYLQAPSIIFRSNNGSDRWTIDSSGHLRPTADNTYDLGASNLRPRNVYGVTFYGSAAGLTANTLPTAESGISAVGNFGQWEGHGTYSNFNTEPNYWGWNYVMGNTNAPNTASGQWYRCRLSLGSQYGKGSDSGDYSMEMAIPRTQDGGQGQMWVRPIEDGNEGSWIEVGSRPYNSVIPRANNTIDLGSSSIRWANIYVNDLQLSNEAKKDTGGNDVDGTWGDWTLQEGEEEIFMINNRTGKKYAMMLREVK